MNARLGVWRHAPPGNFEKLDALRLLLRPFWDRSRTIVATWSTSMSTVYGHLLSQLTSVAGKTAGWVTDGEIVP